MSDKSAIEWTDATWNPVTGCTKVSPGCDHCLDPETLVLYADFTWRRLGDVQVGDILVGFDEHVKNESERGFRMLRPATVTNVWRTIQPAMKVTTDKAEVICSGDHRFIAYGHPHWTHAKNFVLVQLQETTCARRRKDDTMGT